MNNRRMATPHYRSEDLQNQFAYGLVVGSFSALFIVWVIARAFS